MNMPLQGAAADVMKIAMINVYKALKEKVPTAKLILQVHDELIIDAEKSQLALVAEILKTEMENAVKFAVPLTVNVSSGMSWFEAK